MAQTQYNLSFGPIHPAVDPAMGTVCRPMFPSPAKDPTSLDSNPTSNVIQRNPNYTTQQQGTQRLTDREFHDLRSRGLCFRCKQPYHPLHMCQNKTLRVLILGEDENCDVDLEMSEKLMPLPTIHEAKVQMAMMKMSMFALGVLMVREQ